MSDVITTASDEDQRVAQEFNQHVEVAMTAIRGAADTLINAHQASPTAAALACSLVAAEMTYFIASMNEVNQEGMREMLQSLVDDMVKHMAHVAEVVVNQAALNATAVQAEQGAQAHG